MFDNTTIQGPGGGVNDPLDSFLGNPKWRICTDSDAPSDGDKGNGCQNDLPAADDDAHEGEYEDTDKGSPRDPKVDAAKRRLMANSVWARQVRVAKESRYVVKGLLVPDSVAAIYGEPGSGKSFLALDIALSVARGEPWRDCRVKQGCVVYVAAEGGTGMMKRIEAAKAKHAISAYADLPFLLLHCPVNMLVKEEVEAFSEIVSEAAANEEYHTGLPVRMVVIDTLARSMAGGNENSSEHMGAFIDACSRIKDASKCNLLLVHHCGKNKAMGMRGWSGLLGAVDTEIELTKAGEEEGAKVAVAKITKQKDGEDSTEFPFRLEVVTIGEDDEGDPITTCVVSHIVEDGWKAAATRGNLNERERTFTNILSSVIGTEGRLLTPGNGFPDMPVYGVPYEAVRKEFASRAMGITASSNEKDRNSANKAVSRARCTLANKGEIGSHDDWVWLTDRTNAPHA